MGARWLPEKEFRRQLRQRSTDAERRLWSLVRNRRLGAKFRRQHTLGPYTLDFFSPQAMLAIEVDGGQHFEQSHRQSDEVRDASLAARGIEVLRFTDREVLLQARVVGEVIWRAIERRSGSRRVMARRAPPHPGPLPR
jgi:adenine-specific DNA-methyltransferase